MLLAYNNSSAPNRFRSRGTAATSPTHCPSRPPSPSRGGMRRTTPLPATPNRSGRSERCRRCHVYPGNRPLPSSREQVPSARQKLARLQATTYARHAPTRRCGSLPAHRDRGLATSSTEQAQRTFAAPERPSPHPPSPPRLIWNAGGAEHAGRGAVLLSPKDRREPSRCLPNPASLAPARTNLGSVGWSAMRERVPTRERRVQSPRGRRPRFSPSAEAAASERLNRPGRGSARGQKQPDESWP